MIFTVFLFLISIGILIIVHEFGHFIVARWCGVRVKQFSIGFGKKIFSYTNKRTGTCFCLSMIPLGGYVRMLDTRIDNIIQDEIDYAFDSQSVIKRFLIVIAGAIANFLFAFLAFWIIFYTGIATYPVKIESTLPNTPLANVNIPQGAELKSIEGIQIDNWSDVNEILVNRKNQHSFSITYKIKNELNHTVVVNSKDWYSDNSTKPIYRLFGFVPQTPKTYPIIARVVKGSAAEKTGLQVGDEIQSYNGTLYQNWGDFSRVIQKTKIIELRVIRENKLISLRLIPKIKTNSNNEKIGVAGIYPTSDTILKQYDIVTSATKGIELTKITMRNVVDSFYKLVIGEISLKNLTGPIGIAKEVGHAANNGLTSYLFFIGFISVSLGVMNLLPLPVLDGWNLIFIFIEGIKGSPISNTIQTIFYRLGFLLLMIIMGIAFINDFVKL